eukprot:CAMPEP_0175301038 /NCGR_PEP_ID=MMETSP0093-20121207/61422_1 /TAXON_ID=311494 /ORGANISM="Alexandrium monilatum, Strain CCMP3105" /LENGTH=86 /DNA_ID=CAMNT_0016597221 /DNA_START=247 /DNA_END=503 /DNA_ORIENTATION=+
MTSSPRGSSEESSSWASWISPALHCASSAAFDEREVGGHAVLLGASKELHLLLPEASTQAAEGLLDVALALLYDRLQVPPERLRPL